MEEDISWMKKNAISANMWNLIIAFSPNITADSIKNWLKWMMGAMNGENNPINSILLKKIFRFQHQPYAQLKVNS